MSLKLIDAIYNTLKADAEFMALLGLTPTSPSASITVKMVKGMEPEQAISGNTVPMLLMYVKPGRFGSNPLVFEGKFCLDFYGKSSYQAKQMAERAFKLFHDKRIRDTNFGSFLCVLAYEDDFATGITGVKGYESIYDVDYLRTN
ncbi:hypothetical protein SD71_16200 [Cohnella kolymensis]|uniref:Tail completion protein n=1 Tax=Cohnella kolymensis TaxID=1590652 RepID=A0ABR5A2E6_9BACL|nr:hypothetical protein [Cohnella kolymensis]KIL35165.1 hypothetical protein SD71_16200 [Cohnella kolymensis]